MDIHTLNVEHAVLLALFMLLTVINLRMHRRVAGLHWFAVFGFFICLGATLIALRGKIPDLLSIFGGALMFPIGYVCLHRSMAAFFGVGERQWKIQAGLVVLVAAALFEYGVHHPNTTIRLMVFSSILARQVAMTAYLVVRHTPAYMRAAGWLMGLLLALLSLGNVVRLVSLVYQPAPQNYLHGGPMLAWTVLNTTVLQGGTLVAFVWMTAARLHHDLEVQALTDPLTGLLNRRAIEMFAKRTIAASQRALLPVSAILFDLDNFKSINDSFGHLCGDATLIAVARCIGPQIRPGDILARLGGDEFAVLLGDTDVETASTVAQRLRSSLEQLRIPYDRHEVTITGSFGVAQLRDGGDSWPELLSNCDRSLYSVKSGGGNRVMAESLATAAAFEGQAIPTHKFGIQ